MLSDKSLSFLTPKENNFKTMLLKDPFNYNFDINTASSNLYKSMKFKELYCHNYLLCKFDLNFATDNSHEIIKLNADVKYHIFDNKYSDDIIKNINDVEQTVTLGDIYEFVPEMAAEIEI